MVAAAQQCEVLEGRGPAVGPEAHVVRVAVPCSAVTSRSAAAAVSHRDGVVEVRWHRAHGSPEVEDAVLRVEDSSQGAVADPGGEIGALDVPTVDAGPAGLGALELFESDDDIDMGALPACGRALVVVEVVAEDVDERVGSALFGVRASPSASALVARSKAVSTVRAPPAASEA